MFWMADWRHGGESKGELDIEDLVAAIVMPVSGPIGRLPPTPKLHDQPHHEQVCTVLHVDDVMFDTTEVDEVPLSSDPRHDSWFWKVPACDNASCGENTSFQPQTVQPLRVIMTEQSVQTEGKDHKEYCGFTSATELMLDLMGSHPEDADPWLATLMDKDSDFDRMISDATQEELADDEKPAQEELLHNSLKVQIYYFLEDPSTSTAAQVMWLCMGVFILSSVLLMVLQPLMKDITGKEDEQTWFALDAFFTAVFTLEYLLRLSVADALGESRLRFIITPANLCDLLAISPLYVDLALGAAAEQLRLLRLVRLLRLSRISRIARLAKRNPIFGPVMMVLVVVWFIYMKTEATK